MRGEVSVSVDKEGQVVVTRLSLLRLLLLRVARGSPVQSSSGSADRLVAGHEKVGQFFHQKCDYLRLERVAALFRLASRRQVFHSHLAELFGGHQGQGDVAELGNRQHDLGGQGGLHQQAQELRGAPRVAQDVLSQPAVGELREELEDLVYGRAVPPSLHGLLQVVRQQSRHLFGQSRRQKAGVSQAQFLLAPDLLFLLPTDAPVGQDLESSPGHLGELVTFRLQLKTELLAGLVVPGAQLVQKTHQATLHQAGLFLLGVRNYAELTDAGLVGQRLLRQDFHQRP